MLYTKKNTTNTGNYKHYFRIEITYLLLPFSSDCKKKCKLVECHTGHVVRDNLSDLEIT